MPQYHFGSGVLIGTPLTDYAGNALSNPTPTVFGALQDVSIDISADIKQLFGQNQFPLAVGRGKGKISGKAKYAQINALMMNNLFFGQTLNSGIVSDVYDTTGTAIPTTPFTITPTVPSSGTWAFDLGVRDSNGLPMVRVASAPTAGQYSVAAGVYTFAAADTGKVVFINFQYTATSTSAKNQIVQNVLMGQAPSFQADFYTTYGGKNFTLTLYAAIAAKLTIATKQDDFMIPEFDFEAFANGAGQVLKWASTDQ